MFHKDIRVKTNNQIKSSEKKSIIKDILAQYPSLNEDELKNVIKVKESEITLTKLSTHDNNDVFVYIIDKIPYLFRVDKDDKLLPTVYFLWKFPNILPKFYTHNSVFNKLVNGADLMLPGVIVDGEMNLYTFKDMQKNQLCCVCLGNNSVPIALGKTAISGEDMYMSGMKGRGVNILHIFKDNLWMLGDKSLEPPIIEKSIFVEKKEDENVDSSSVQDENKKEDELCKIEKLILEDNKENSEKNEENNEIKASEINEELKMSDELLKTIFFATLKFKSKEIKLPIIVSTFTKILQDCCPKEVDFDLKQTSYKKISTFLKQMENYGCINLKEIQKGVLAVSNINKENELVKFIKRPSWFIQPNMEEIIAENFILDVIDMYKIDGNTEELFKKQYKKGDVLNSQEIRQYVMNYIKEENLQSQENKKMIKVDNLLAKILKLKSDTEIKISFENLFSQLFDKLSPMHSIVYKYSDNKERESPILKKGKFKPIEFKIESRGGNKKLTVIYNLNEFLIDSKELQQKIRIKVGCSASIDFSVSGAASNVSDDYTITVQGNQINQVSRLLKNEYGIQLKHMNGLDLGVKE